MNQRDAMIVDCLEKVRVALDFHNEHKLVDYVDFMLDQIKEGSTPDKTYELYCSQFPYDVMD